MNSDLFFSLETEWLQTGYDELRKHAFYVKWNEEKKRSDWVFPLKALPEVLALLGSKQVSFDEKQAYTVIQYCEPLKQFALAQGWKGTSGFKVVDCPKFFIVEEHRNMEDIKTGEVKVKKMRHTVTREAVKTAWKAIEGQPRELAVKSSTVAAKIVKLLGLTRFNHKNSDNFDFQKFFGSRGEAYFPLFYYPMKVLQDKNVIKYHVSGHIERIGEYAEQTFFPPEEEDE